MFVNFYRINTITRKESKRILLLKYPENPISSVFNCIFALM